MFFWEAYYQIAFHLNTQTGKDHVVLKFITVSISVMFCQHYNYYDYKITLSSERYIANNWAIRIRGYTSWEK